MPLDVPRDKRIRAHLMYALTTGPVVRVHQPSARHGNLRYPKGPGQTALAVAVPDTDDRSNETHASTTDPEAFESVV